MSDNASDSERASAAGQRRTVLVAENDRALRDLLRVHLQNAGYNVILAPDAMVAGRTILQRPLAVDVLVANVEMPFMSGVELVATLIADRSLPFIPTIIIAASDQDARRADLLGVPSLVTPFSAERFVDLVHAVIQHTDPTPATPPEPRPSLRQRLDDLTVPIEPIRRPLRIVVADDEPDTVTSLMTILCHEGHSVFGSHHAPEVLPEVRTNKPDAVILDIDMPGISGFAIAREIREVFGETSPLLIAVSGKWFGQTDRMLAQLAGFDYFLQKPCHPDALLAMLERRPPAETRPEGFACEPSLTFQT